MVLSAGASPKSPLRLGIPARPTTHNRSAHEKIPRSPHSAHHGTSRSVPTETHCTAAEQSRDGSLIDRSPIDAQEPSLACSLPNRATNQSLTHPRPGPAYALPSPTARAPAIRPGAPRLYCGDGYVVDTGPDAAVRGGGTAGARAPPGADAPDRPPWLPRPRRRAPPRRGYRSRTRRPRPLDPRVPRPPPPRPQVTTIDHALHGPFHFPAQCRRSSLPINCMRICEWFMYV